MIHVDTEKQNYNRHVERMENWKDIGEEEN
jgi:hypothetical protein